MAKYVSPFMGIFGRGGQAGAGAAKGYSSPFADVFGGTAGQRHRKEVDKITPLEEAKAAAKKEPAKKDGRSLTDKIGDLFLGSTAKLANTAAEGGKDAVELARAGLGAATGNDKAEKAAIKRALTDRYLQKGSGLFGAGGVGSGQEIRDLTPGGLVKKSVGSGLGVASEVLPVGRGLGIASKGEKILKTVGRGAAEGVGIGAAGSAGSQLVDKGNLDLKKTLEDAGLAGVLGGLGAGVGRVAGRGVDKLRTKNISPEDLSLKSLANVPAGLENVNTDSALRRLNAESDASKALTPSSQKLLPAVTKTKKDSLASRLTEIDDELTSIQKDPNTTVNAAENTNEALLTAGKTRKSGELDQRFNSSKTAGTIKPSDQLVDASTAAPRFKALKAERKAIQSELEGLDALPTPQKKALKVDTAKPANQNAVKNELDNVERSVAPIAGEKVTGKVNVLRDYAGIGMSKTFRKIGLGKTADLVEHSFEKMRVAQYNSEKQLKDWVKAVKDSPDARQRIFDHLNGGSIKLTPSEQKVANEMKDAFAKFADEQGIPKEGRIQNYITRLFDEDKKRQKQGQDYDPLVNSILENKATSQVAQPFLKHRTGAQDYKHDAFAAFEAYMQKANRNIHMKDAVKAVGEHAKQDGIDGHTADYLARSSQTLAGRQKQQFVDRVLDGVVDSALGTQRGGTRALRGTRNLIYKGTMGFNFGSALQNLTQITNTFAEQGARNTTIGYSKLFRAFKDAAEQRAAGKEPTALDEFFEHGIFDDAIHKEGEQMTVLKNNLQKLDKGAWAMFTTAERINRGAAYMAAKHGALKKGLSEEAAQEVGRKAVAKTQFKFNEIETPLGLQSEVAKSLLQFQSFNLRQMEFLGGIGKGAIQGKPEDIVKAVRWLAANAVVYGSIGSLLGMDWKNSIPLLSFRGITNPTVQLGEGVKNVATGQDKYGNDIGRGAALKAEGKNAAALLIPGGTQAKKTIEGVQATDRGASQTATGRIRFPVSQDASTRAQAAIFGQYSLPESRKHFKNKAPTLSAHQTEVIQNIKPELRPQYYDFIASEQGMNKKRSDSLTEIRKLANDGQSGKAERKINEYNDQVDRQFSQFFRDHPHPANDLLDVYVGLKIPISKQNLTPKKPQSKSKL